MSTQPPRLPDVFDALDPLPPVGRDVEQRGDAQAPSSAGEIWSANRRLSRTDRTDAEEYRWSEHFGPVIEALGLGASQNPGHFAENNSSYTAPTGSRFELPQPGVRAVNRATQLERIAAAIVARRLVQPDFAPGVPSTPDQIRIWVNRQEEQARDRARNVQAGTDGSWGQWFAGMGGSMWELTTDPLMLATLPIGSTARNLSRVVITEAIVGATTTAITQPMAARHRQQLGEELTTGEALTNIAVGGIGQGLFGGAFLVGGRAGGRGAGRAYDIGVETLFRVMPEAVQQRWAGRMSLDVADGAGGTRRLSLGEYLDNLPDGDQAQLLRDLQPTLTVDEQAAINVVERDSEVDQTSPYEPSIVGDDVHAERMQDALTSLLERRTPTEPTPDPTLTPTARPRADSAPRRAAADDDSGPVPRYINEGNSPARLPYGRWQVGDGYGARRGGGSRLHGGVDIFAAMGEAHPMARPYTIERVYHGAVGGHTALVRFDDGSTWKAMHLPERNLPTARRYQAGENVLRSGDSGNADAHAPHIHWQPANRRAQRIYARGRRAVADYLFGTGVGGGRGTSGGTGGGLSSRVLAQGELADIISNRETGGRNIRNQAGASSASGLFQFTDDTWVRMHRLTFPGFTGNRMAQKGDTAIQAQVMQRTDRYYRDVLGAAEVPLTAGNMYLAHFLGAENAVNALRNPTRSINELEPKAVSSNPFISGLTANQVRLWAWHRIDGNDGNEALRLAKANVEPEGGDGFTGPSSYAGTEAADDAAAIAELRSQALDAQRRAIGETPAPAGGFTPPMSTRQYRPGELLVDAERFQFKGGGDGEGVTDRLAGVTEWNPIYGGRLVVWEDLQGRSFVADGHQRSGLARRLEADGHPDIMLDATVLREADGVTAQDARVWAALKNIAEGTGSPVDVAKVIRDAGEDVLRDLPPKSALVRDGAALSRLSDDAFAMVYNGRVPAEFAAVVGHLLPDRPEAHANLVDLLIRLDPANRGQAESLVRQGIAAGFHKAEQIDLFGARELNTSLFVERAKVLERGLARLRRAKLIYGTAAREADTLERAGSRIARSSTEREASRNAEALEVVARLAFSRGPIADALNDSARRLAGGEQLASVVDAFVNTVRGIDLRAAAKDSGTDGASSLAPDGAGRGGDARAAGGADQGADGGLSAAELEEAGQASIFGAEESAARFSDPQGDAAKAQTESLEHDVRMDVEAAAALDRAPEGAAVVGQLPQTGLAPANIGVDGKIYVGREGGSHFEVMEQFPEGGPWTGGTGFATPEGKYLTRPEALAWVEANERRVRPSQNMDGELDALDYRDQVVNRRAAEPVHPRTGVSLTDAKARALELRNSFEPIEEGNLPGTQNIPNSAPAPDGKTRGELRSRIVEQLLAAPARAEREAHIVMGPPASGKSSFSDPLAAARGARVIDSDDAKKLLPEFEDGVGAMAVHAESATLADVAVGRTLERGENMVLPIVGKHYEGLAARIEQLVAAGYRVHMHLVELPIEQAVERAIKRYGTSGRLVDPDYVASVGDGPSQRFAQALKDFDGKLEGYIHVSNDVAKGQPPRLIAASDPGLPGRLGFDRAAGAGKDAPGPARQSGGEPSGAAGEGVSGLDKTAPFAADFARLDVPESLRTRLRDTSPDGYDLGRYLAEYEATVRETIAEAKARGEPANLEQAEQLADLLAREARLDATPASADVAAGLQRALEGVDDRTLALNLSQQLGTLHPQSLVAQRLVQLGYFEGGAITAKGEAFIARTLAAAPASLAPSGRAAALEGGTSTSAIAAVLDRGAEVDPAIAARQARELELGAAAPLRPGDVDQMGEMGLGLFDAVDQPGFRLDVDGEPRAANDVLKELDDDARAIDALEACMKPGKAA